MKQREIVMTSESRTVPETNVNVVAKGFAWSSGDEAPDGRGAVEINGYGVPLASRAEFFRVVGEAFDIADRLRTISVETLRRKAEVEVSDAEAKT